MPKRLFYRNIYARDHLEVFLVSSVTSLLALRFYLHATGYPQVGNGTLHIAHMLWGGLLMLAAIIINLTFLGLRAQRTSSVVGGVGFGIFIDELGKFITRDNNYFFRPTIGLIYAIFAILYLVVNFLTRLQKFNSEEYQMNALQQFEEAVRHDMDPSEKKTIAELLAKSDQNDPVTQELEEALGRIQTVRKSPSRYSRWLDDIGRLYARFWRQRRSSQLVAFVFILESLVFLGFVLGNIFNSFDSASDLLHRTDTYSTRLIIGQLAASAVSAVFALIGAYKLTHSRLEAFEWFRRALLVNLFLTEFFIFSRIQFGALPGFIANLLLLLAIRAALVQEHRLANKS